MDELPTYEIEDMVLEDQLGDSIHVRNEFLMNMMGVTSQLEVY